MAAREERRVLDGRVEIDGAYLGGEKPGKRRRGSENKIPFVVAVQITDDGRPMFASLKRMPFTQEAVSAWANRAIAGLARVVSDGLHCFAAIKDFARHEAHTVDSGRKAVAPTEFSRVNTVLGNLKTAISGMYHAFKFSKYADRYLAEVQYQFNRRFDLSFILVRLVRVAAETVPRLMQAIRLAEVCR